MAVARRIQTLLAVNILVFVGIVLFSAYCRLQDRAGRRAQLVRGSDRRARSRLAGAGAGTDREAILRRLGHLEEVVYNQLNGESTAGCAGRGRAEGCLCAPPGRALGGHWALASPRPPRLSYFLHSRNTGEGLLPELQPSEIPT